MLSIVIPVWSGTQVMIDMHVKLCISVDYDCDELIVCEDGPFCPELSVLADNYIVNKERLGHARNLQSGIDAARGDYIGVLDSDVIIKKGSMRDLCVPGKFTEAKWLDQIAPQNTFIIWCSVAEKRLYKEYPLPTSGEVLDHWAQRIPFELIYRSDKVEYEHHTGITYTEWKKVHGK